jgi:hypothetical protein
VDEFVDTIRKRARARGESVLVPVPLALKVVQFLEDHEHIKEESIDGGAQVHPSEDQEGRAAHRRRLRTT